MTRLSRRAFVHQSALLTAVTPWSSSIEAFPSDSECGVCSADPTPTSIIIWTRVPTYSSAQVRFDVALDASFKEIVQSGQLSTDAASDFTARVKVEGLAARTTYYYRFSADCGYRSVVGRTKTAPAAGDMRGPIRVAFLSCQDFTTGYYTVFDALASDDIDVVVHLGDNIYETGKASFQKGAVREDNIGNGEAKTLEEYRAKYKLYLSDYRLREVRRLFPWVYLRDDHEVFNNYAGGDMNPSQIGRQQAGCQAFAEYCPFDSNITGGMHRSLKFGGLLELIATDQRTFRTARSSSDPVILGASQRQFLFETLAGSECLWKALLSEVMLMPLRLRNVIGIGRDLLEKIGIVEDGMGYYRNMDQWDGYPSERALLTEYLHREAISNVVVCTGDIHNYYSGTVHVDPDDATSPTVAHEFVTASVSSNGIAELIGSPMGAVIKQTLYRHNKNLNFMDTHHHGYIRLEVTAASCRASMVAVQTVKKLISDWSDIHSRTISAN